MLSTIIALKFDFKTTNEGNMKHYQSILREALLKFNDIEKEIIFH